MRITRLIFAAVAIFAATLPASAQKAIDDEIARLEARNDVQVYYTEKRNPATKKIYKESKTVIFGGGSNIRRVRQAFQKERENSTEATRSKNGIESLMFRTKNGKFEYNLVENQNGAVLSIEKKIYDNYPKDHGSLDKIVGGQLNKLDFDTLSRFNSLSVLECIDMEELSRQINTAARKFKSTFESAFPTI